MPSFRLRREPKVEPTAKSAKMLKALDEWPDSWTMQEKDKELGEELVKIFRELLLALHLQGLAQRTIDRHCSNLWILGGEAVREWNTPTLSRDASALQLLQDIVSEEGGPLLRGQLVEGESQAFDATCRRLFRYLQDNGAANSKQTEV